LVERQDEMVGARVHFGISQPPDAGVLIDVVSDVDDEARSPWPGMARWRERLHSGLARIATRSTDFFRIPPDRVIELGAEVEI
jgi:hypothetical protein